MLRSFTHSVGCGLALWFALRVFMRVLSHGWTEGLNHASQVKEAASLLYNATQSWRSLLWFLSKQSKQTSKKPKAIHHITKIHVDTGKNPCQSKEMEMELTFLGTWGGDWWTKPYWEIWGECIMSGEGLFRMCAVEIKTPLICKHLQCCPIKNLNKRLNS